MLSAIENENVDIIGHPTGRLLGQRESYDIDLSRVIKAASDTKTALEINASPYRLDLDDTAIKEARDNNVKLSIGTDAHDRNEFNHIAYGIMIARRGWCRSIDVLNTFPMKELLELTSQRVWLLFTITVDTSPDTVIIP
jgi:DNA polymerase (family 10)